MEVAFNPDAKTFLGFENYMKVMWGRGIGWSPFAHPFVQTLLLVTVAVVGFRARVMPRGRLIGFFAFIIFFFIILGFEPNEGGRWHDRRFWPTVTNTVIFSLFAVPSVTITAMVLAAMLNRETKVMAFYRTIFFLSQVLSVTVVTLIWQIMFSPRQGIIGNFFAIFGVEPVNWLTSEGWAMAAIVITTVWWSLGIAMVLFLAGLQDIPKETYEAARLDRAKGLRGFWYITLPNLRRVTLLVVVLQIILHFQVFGQSHLMTKGGPNDSTQVLVR